MNNASAADRAPQNIGLAGQIERDLLRSDDAEPRDDITRCFMCGHGMMYRGNRFCSDRCRDYYDAGNPGYAQDWLRPKVDWYGIKSWKVIAGPPGVEVGSDYYRPLRDAFSAPRKQAKRQQASPKVKRSKIANYTVKANGHGYWQPSTTSRSLGFKSVDCGFDGDEARSKARELNAAASVARKGMLDRKNTNREAA
jgi:hypothetical protein